MEVNFKYELFSIMLLLLVSKCGGQITSNLQDEIKCTGDSVTLRWVYIATNEIVATWQFGSDTIMTSVAGGAPVIEAAYSSRATHGGNGELALAGLTEADNGTYSLDVTYSAAPLSANDEVIVTVFDKIMEESTPTCGNDIVTCGNSSMTGVSYSWRVDGSAVSDTSWSISSQGGTKTYECTISGDRVTNCLDAGVSTTKSASCTTPGKPCDTTCVIIICVVIYVLGIVAVLIVLAVVRRFCKTCPCCGEYTGIGCRAICVEYTGIGCRAICVIIGTSLGMGIIVAVVILIILGIEKKLPCQKGSQQKKPDSGNSGSRSVTPNQVSPSIITTTPRTESGNATNQENEAKDPLPKTEDKPRHQELQPLTNATNVSDLNTKQKLPDIPSKKSS